MTTKLNYGLPVLFEGLNQADCRDVFTFWDDFLDSSMSATADVARWRRTIITGTLPTLLDGTDASQELSGGIVDLAVSGTASKTSTMAVNGESFQIAKGHELYFECRWTNTDTDVSTFVGLSNEASGASGDISPIEALAYGMGFLTITSALWTSVAKSTANLDLISGITIAALTWNRAAIHFDGVDTVKFYFAQDDDEMVEVNSLSLTTVAHYIPSDTMLTPTLEAEQQTGGASTAGSMYVDYVLCQQARQRVAD